MKVVLCPGYIGSATDRQVHYVDERHLAALYQLRLEDCLVLPYRVSLPIPRAYPDEIYLGPQFRSEQYARIAAWLKEMP